MRIFKRHDFGRVSGYEFGWSPVGRPLMTVFCYIMGPVMIDTGPPHLRSEACGLAVQAGIRGVLLTHYHEDHSGNAAAIQSVGVPAFAGSRTVEKLSRPYSIFPYQHLMWGANEPVAVNALSDVCEVGGFCFEAIATPGHSKDHTVYLERGNGWLFSGDLYLSHRIKYFRADERIADQIDSLKKVLALDFNALFCAHRPQPQNGKAFIRQKLQFLEDFAGKVTILAQSGMDEAAIMKALHLKEQKLIKWLCFGNVSMKNMVRSTMRSINGRHQHFG